MKEMFKKELFINFFYDDNNNNVLLDFRLSNLDISIKLKILWTDYVFLLLHRCLFIVATISWPYGISLVAKNITSGLPKNHNDDRKL